jgi:dihydroflavonol-4-reductase
MVLITGGSGFVGQSLARYLSGLGLKVRALYHNHPPPDDLKHLPGIEWAYCDLLDIFDVEKAMMDITDVYHCAAIVSFNPRAQEDMLHFNPESTANLVNQALQQCIRKMVYVSSVAALGRTGEAGKEINEDVEWSESNYNSAYGLSKYLAETEVWRGIGEGLNAVIINPGIILGPGDWDKGSAQLMKVASREFPFFTTGATAWVGIADVVSIMVMLMGSDIEAERYIVSAGNFPFRQIFSLMAETLHKKPPRIRASSFITGISWRLSRIFSGKNAAITRETAIIAGSVSNYNNSKLLDAFPGFSYTPVNRVIEMMALSFNNSYKK